MNAWQLDAIKDQIDTKAWIDLNAPDPCERQLKTCSASLIEATQFLQIAENRLADAMTEVFDTPMEARIGSFLDDLQDMRIDLQELANKYGKGVRE